MKKNKSVTESFQDELDKDAQGCFVAAILMISFAGSLGCGFYLVIVIVHASLAYAPADRSTAIKDALQILMTIGTLFSPLLAFVLGYYFNQSQSAHNQVNKSVASNDTTNQPEEKTGESLNG